MLKPLDPQGRRPKSKCTSRHCRQREYNLEGFDDEWARLGRLLFESRRHKRPRSATVVETCMQTSQSVRFPVVDSFSLSQPRGQGIPLSHRPHRLLHKHFLASITPPHAICMQPIYRIPRESTAAGVCVLWKVAGVKILRNVAQCAQTLNWFRARASELPF